MSIRIAVIGTGIMGADHARIISGEIPDASLQAVCDVDDGRARQVADEHGAAQVFTDPEEAVRDDSVDAVIIASPDHTHAPLTLSCIAAGKRVLCEKPLSQESAECLKVMEAEEAAGERMVQVGFMRRYDQSYVRMKKALDGGELGRALLMNNFHRNVETPSSDFTSAMAITNSAPHEFGISRHVLGTEHRSITASQPKRSDGVVAPVLMVLRTADDQLIHIEINNNAAYGYDVRAELVGERASIAMNHVAYTRTDAALESKLGYDADWRGRYAEAYRRQDKAFVKFAATGEFTEIAADAWDGYCAALTAEIGVQALMEGREIRIESIDKPGFYR